MMKRLILILTSSTVIAIGAQSCGLNSFNHLYGANSPIFSLPLYYSDKHFEYDQVKQCKPITDNCKTKKCIIQSKLQAPEPKKMVQRYQKQKQQPQPK